MKALSQYLLYICGWLLISSPLSAFTEVADGALKFTTDASITRDSNFQGNAFGDSDTIYSIMPGLTWTRDIGRIKINTSASVNFQRHDNYDQYDGEYLNADFSITAPFAPGSPMSGRAKLGYNESTRIDDSLNQRISQDITSANMALSYRFRPKVSADLTAAYQDTSTANFSNTEDYSVALGATWHQFWKDVSLSVDYRIRNASTSGYIGAAADNEEDSFSLSLNGQLLPRKWFPKLEAMMAFRLQNNSSLVEDEADKQILGFQAGLRWPARETTTLSLSLNRDFELSADDRTTEVTRLNFGILQKVGNKASLEFQVDVADMDTLSINRSSTRLTASLIGDYQLNRYLYLNAGASWSQTDSSYPSGDYSKTIFRIGASFRY